MNFLAHLHLASLANSSLLGNLMADFVRGNPHDAWSPAVAEGILLHRRIDVLTDSLPEVRLARRHFRDETYRVAPIALDVIWDHFLALHWDTLQPDIALPTFLASAQLQILPNIANTPAHFQNLNRSLWQERWMERYAEAPYLQHVLRAMALRRPRLAALSATYQDFVDNYHHFSAIFTQFYPRMMAQARQNTL